jgi:hypothetical protein
MQFFALTAGERTGGVTKARRKGCRVADPGQSVPALWGVRISLTLPAGEIPASARGMSRPTGNRALGSWR